MTWQHEQIKRENIDVEVMIGEIYVQEEILSNIDVREIYT